VKSIAKPLFASTLLGLFAYLVATPPAMAITADLANKCRQLAIKAHPPQRIGAKTGAAGAERKYYRDCIANGGSAADKKTQTSPAAPAR
jgi:hypothetical protein